MNVSRTRISTRLISVLLVLCMVFGMVPASALRVFAADSDNATTQSSLEAIQAYASNLLNSNFSKISGADLTWDTEGKSDTWRYYNGVMLDALLMLGVDSDAGNALEFAKDFMDVNIDSSGKITKYTTKEVDSVPPALTLIALLDTAEVDSATRADYVTAINYVYGQLEKQTKYSQCGGNFLHKMENDSWSTWNIGLDGIYMAQPFLMEYAAALEAGKITNTVNSKSASDIYKEVYDRLMWVADTMYDEGTGLYHHGWNVSDSEGNGHFWSRGIGWYAAGLVMCIDLMPAGTYKTNLVSKLPKLFDGMMQYQDEDTGLWYNVVNQDSSLTSNNGNKLETSGSALMAYAMVKAYNEGWVDAKYATAGVEAFNGIVANKLKSGKITDIYKSSGVCTDDADYCKNSYVSDEAKGVGGVIMAAAEVDKYLGNTEEFDVGVVVAPEMTIVAGATTVDATNIKVTLLGNQGTILKGADAASKVTYKVGEPVAAAAAEGNATATVYAYVGDPDNGGALIDTFEVNVVDPNTPATGEGTLVITPDASVPGDGTKDSDSANVTITTAGSTTYTYTLFTGDPSTITANQKFLIVSADGTKALMNPDTGTSNAQPISADVSPVAGTTNQVTLASGDALSVWTISDLNTTSKNGITYYGGILGNNSRNFISNNTTFLRTGTVTVFIIPGSATGKYYLSNSFSNNNSGEIKSGNFYHYDSSNGWIRNGTIQEVYLYSVTTTEGGADGTDEYTVTLEANQTGKLLNVGDTDTLSATLKAALSDGTSATPSAPITWSSSNSNAVSVNASTGAIKAEGEGSAVITATISKVSIGGTEVDCSLSVDIPVTVVDSANYDVDLSVNPGAIVATVGDGNTQLNVSKFTVGDLGGIGYYVKYSGGNDSVATVTEDGLVTIVGEGSTTITATVTAITYDSATYDADDFGTITATIPVVVNAEPVVQEVTYSITGLTVLPNSVIAGEGAQATATAAASDGSGNHSYVFNYAISGSGVSIDSATGAITTTSEASGTYTVTATLGQVDGNGDFNAGTVNKTATFTVVAADAYEYTILGSNGSALEGQNITLNEGDTYTPTFSVKLGDQDLTTGYQLTLSSESTAITITGTTITANKVSEDTVATVTATVAPLSRAAASGTSVEFTVTVKAAAEEEPTTTPTTPSTGDISVPSVNADTVYTRLTALTDKYTYVVIGRNSSTRTATHGTDPGVLEAAWSSVEGGWKYGAVAHMWVIEKIDNSSNYYIYYMDGTTKYYLNGDGTNNLVCSATADTQWAITFNGEQAGVTVASGTHGNADNRIYLNIDGSNGPKFESSAQSLNLYAPVVTAPTYTLTLTPATSTVKPGETVDLTASLLLGSDAVTEGVTYTWSVNSTNSTVEGNGTAATFTAGSVGETVTVTVNATIDGEEVANATATVKVVAVTGGSLSKSEVSVANGADVDLSGITLTLNLSDGTTKTVANGDLTFNPGDIDTNVAAATEVPVTVTYTDSEYGYEYTDTVTVKIAAPITVTGVALSPEKLDIANGGTVDTGSVQMVLTMSNGSTQTVANSALTFDADDLAAVDVNTAGTYYVTVTDADGNTAELAVVVAAASTGNGDWVHNFSTDGTDNDFYSFSDKTLLSVTSTVNGVSYTKGLDFSGDNDTITFTAPADGTLTMVFTDSSPKVKVNGTNNQASGNVLTIDVAAGTKYTIAKNNPTEILYLEYVPSGEVVVAPSSATVTPDKVDVPNSGTVDLSGVTMEVTMSDGSKKTIENADLTYDVSGINTALGGTYTVPVSYAENGKTVTANVTVVVAAASSGGGTETSELWIHDFTEDGETDTDGFYSISGNYTTSYSGSYDNRDFTKALKMESSTKVSFTAPNAGTFTLVFDTKDSPSHSVYLTDPNGTKTSYTVPSNGVLTIDLAEGGEYLLQKNSGSSYVFYMEYASAITDGIQITKPGTLYIAGSEGVLYPTHELQYTVMHNEQPVTEGYEIEWSVLDATVASVEDGVITGLKPGSTSVTAKVTMEDGTEYTGTVVVTVMAPAVDSTEEMALIAGKSGKESGTISSTVYAGGVAKDYTLGYFSSNESVAAVDENGVVTAVDEGTATIYTYIKTVNGNTVYTGDGSNLDFEYFDTTEVTVERMQVTGITLNAYDYGVKVNSEGNKNGLIDVLEYEHNVQGGILADEGVVLTIEYNTGAEDTKTIYFTDANGDGTDDNDSGLKIDLSAVNITKPDIYMAPITYTDANGEVIFRDTLWIHVEDFELDKYDGILTTETGINWVLHTGAFTEEDANREYIIVYQQSDTSGIALRNPSVSASGSTAAGTASVTLHNGQVKSEQNPGEYLFGGAAVDYLTISKDDSYLSDWLLDTFVDSNPNDNVVQLNMSNFQRYLGYSNSTSMLIHNDTRSVQLVTVDAETGECQIILGSSRNRTYYLGYANGAWTASTTPSSVYLYCKDIEQVLDLPVDFDLYDKEYDKDHPDNGSKILSNVDAQGNHIDTISIPDGFAYDAVNPVITIHNYHGDDAHIASGYTVEWTSSNPSVATVNQNGVITAVSEGKAIITATVYDVYGETIICNNHNVEHICKTVEVEVTDSDPTPVLDPKEMTIGVGTMPNFSKVVVKMTYPGTDGEYDYEVPFEQLNFKLADATGTADDGTEMDRFDNTVTGTYKVPVTYAGNTFNLTVKVVEDPYAGLEEADAIPGFPDAGSVRMNKTAVGVLDFAQTGVTKIELTAAGVSTKSSVDVVLIVDVSNSMGWTTTWFEGMSNNQVEDATDSQKIPAGGAGTGTDKLALAMNTADRFADILLNVDGGDNTLTFVTFAGADRNHGGSSDYVDSVRTPMVGISDYDIASQVFKDTRFTTLSKNGSGATYELQIGGYTETIDGKTYGEAKVSGNNRGNTNYDYAFGQAISAVSQIKAKYSAQNDGASYDESGRQIHVVFMTDGAPSHYNDKKGNGNAKDTLWDGSGTYSDISSNSEANWLKHIQNYNELATELYPMVDGAYTVAFDMAHGGFGDYSYGLDEMQRVLEGLAMNTVVPVELADNEEELDEYFTSLGRALAYAGTKAQVTDTIGGKFSLFTGPSMYSSDITQGGIMSEETLAAMQAMSFPITVNSYRLVTVSDIGTTNASLLDTNGNSISVDEIKEEHLGLRFNEDPEILEQITFNDNGTEAYSNLNPGVNIMSNNSNGERVIEAETFTYTATLDTVKHEGVETVHAKDESIVWKIGTITDHEVAMEYYAYLDGSLDNPREAVSGVYATNEYAYAEYIDVYGKYVKRYYGVPQIAWGAGNVTVRFYLVNEDGQFVNRAGVAFTNPANRIFLDGRAHYQAELNNSVSFTAQDALTQAGLAGTNILYDTTDGAGAIVTNSTTAGQGGIDWTIDTSLSNIENLLIYTDSSNGYYTNVIIDIPVVMTDLGESLRPLAGETVVIDYGKPVDINVFSAEEKAYVAGYPDVRNPDQDGTKYWYTMEIVGFSPYSSSFDQKDYVQATAFTESLTTANGTYTVTSKNGDTQVKFTPNGIMKGTDQVFVVVAFQEYAAIANGDGTYRQGDINKDRVYYMYKQLNVVPANVMYYETDGNMDGAFNKEGSWTLVDNNDVQINSVKSGVQDPDPGDDVKDIYGYDSSYIGAGKNSNGSSYLAAGEGVTVTTAQFTFTGTGFDLISRTGAEQGSIRVLVFNGSNVPSDLNNYYKKISVINKGENDLYQLPVVSVEDMPYGTYTVLVGVYQAVDYSKFELPESMNIGNQFYFDAVRIYNTAQGDKLAEAEYEADGQLNAVVSEIRDAIISRNDFDQTNSTEDSSGVLYIDQGTGNGSYTVTDYAEKGPNNELYLAGVSESAIAFKLETSNIPASLAIGAKSADGNSVGLEVTLQSLDGNVTHKVPQTIETNTALYYDLLSGNDAPDPKAIFTLNEQTGKYEAYVVIRNTGEGILSLTDIKLGYSTSAIAAGYNLGWDARAVAVAKSVLNPNNDVISVTFNEDSARPMAITEMTVVTTQNVTKLQVTDEYGQIIWSSGIYLDTAYGDRIWTVQVCPTLLGEQTITVTGYGADGTAGASASDSIYIGY